VVVAGLLRKRRIRVALARITLKLLTRQRPRQVLLIPHIAHVEAQRRASVQAIAVGGVQAAVCLLAVVAVAVEFGIREAEIDVKRAIHLTSRQLILQETERASLAAELQQ